MDRTRSSRSALCLLTGCLAIAGSTAHAARASTRFEIGQPLPATPVGITLMNVVKVVGVAPPHYLWTRLGDGNGKTLYTSDADTTPGRSMCIDACAKDFPPVLADRRDVAFGDWSLVKRPEGTLQWAYQGKPLYTYAKEASLIQVIDTLDGQGIDDGPASQGRGRATPPKNQVVPPKGWSVARFNPEKNLVLPALIHVETVAVQDGLGDALVTGDGMTLYGFEGSAKAASKAACVKSGPSDQDCKAVFQPYLAPDTAQAVGDFSIVKGGPRGDAAQWAYRGTPLYTFSGDHKPTDAYGVYENHGPWRVMFVYLDVFPENVQAVESIGHDKILADAQGRPLYQRAHFRELFGGPTNYRGFGGAPYMGLAVGTGACDVECLKVRRPLLAPPDAQPKGDWMVYTRKDGTKQWAFQGFALYTYTVDTRPGIVDGNNENDYVVGDVTTYTIEEATFGDPGGGGMGVGSHKAGLYWYVSHPDWQGR